MTSSVQIEIARESPSALDDYAEIPIAYEVHSIFDVVPVDGGLGGLSLAHRLLEVPWTKDYDADPVSHPARWGERFDLSHWQFLMAREAGRPVGAGAVVHGASDIKMLEGRRDLAVLWDLRVSPGMRSRGVGSALFRAASAWATEQGARQLEVETQNVNVPACRFYARQGCTLGAIRRFAYPRLPDEVQLLWYRDLSGSRSNT